MDAGVLAFSRFRIDGIACLVIGGVRGQRHPVLRASPMEISQALKGWKPSVLMVRVAQELARFWGLRIIGLDPAAHRLHGWSYQWTQRSRDAGQRVYASLDALWAHFEADQGPAGLGDRAAQLGREARGHRAVAGKARAPDPPRRLLDPHAQPAAPPVQAAAAAARAAKRSWSRVTEAMDRDSMAGDEPDFEDSEDMVPSRVLQTGPGSLL